MAFERQDFRLSAGNARHKFTVYKEVLSIDDMGGKQTGYERVYTGWMAVRVNDAFETGVTNQADLQEQYYQLEINYNPLLKSEHIIVWRTKKGTMIFAIEGMLQMGLEQRRVVVNARVRKDLNTHNFA